MEKRISSLTAFGARIVAGSPLPDSPAPDPQALVGFYKKNKYPLLAFKSGRNGHAFLHSPEFSAALEDNAATLKSLRSEYVLVRNRWAEQGIPCITLKSGGSFLPFPYTSDNLDILIHKEDEDVARATLVQFGYLELKNLEEPQKFLFRKFHAGEIVSDIHLHTRIGWGVGFMNEDKLWPKAVVSPDDAAVMIPSPEDTVLITLAHSFYENKCLRLADLIKVSECFKGVFDWEYIKETADQAGWLDGLSFSLALCAYLEETVLGKASVPLYVVDECLSQLAKSNLLNRYYQSLKDRTPVVLPFTVSFIFSKFLFYRKIMQDPRYSLEKRLYETIRTTVRGIRLKAHIRPQSSFLVSFSGLDGSGKTQHARILQSCLNACALKTEYHWTRCGTFGLTQFFSRLVTRILSRNSEKHNSKQGAEGRSARLQNPLFRFIWTYLAAIDIIISNFWHVRLPLLRGRIVLCDRYVFDAAAEMESSLVIVNRLNRLAINLMLASAPKPDIAYFLDVPESISTERKDANTEIDYLRQLRRNYLKLAGRYHLSIKETAREFDATADEIVREVAAPYFEKYPTLMNGLFLSNPSQINRQPKTRAEMRVLVVTNMYPTPEKPAAGTFVKEQVDSLKKESVDVDVFYVDGSQNKLAYLWGLVRFWAKLLQKRYDIIHAHYVFSGFIARAQYLYPVVLTHHGLEVFMTWQRFPSRIITPLVDQVILVSEEQKRKLGCKTAEIIPCGINLEFFKPVPKEEARKKLNLPLDKKLVLWVGNHLRPEKRFDIVEAAIALARAKDPSIELVLVDGQPHEVVPLYMSAGDAVLLVSDAEGSPMVIHEAMACNLPIVSVPVGDVPEVIHDTDGCYLCTQNPEDVAEKLALVLKYPGRTGGRERIKYMEEGATAQRILNLYQQVLQKRKRGVFKSIVPGRVRKGL